MEIEGPGNEDKAETGPQPESYEQKHSEEPQTPNIMNIPAQENQPKSSEVMDDTSESATKVEPMDIPPAEPNIPENTSEKMDVAQDMTESNSAHDTKPTEKVNSVTPESSSPVKTVAEPQISENVTSGENSSSVETQFTSNQTETTESKAVEPVSSGLSESTGAKAVSIFASLFSPPKPADSMKSMTPTPIEAQPQTQNVSSPKPDTNIEAEKQIKAEAIAENESALPTAVEESSTSEINSSGSTGEVVKRASPRLQQQAENSAKEMQATNSQNMDVDAPAPSPKATSSKPITPRPHSTSPRTVTDVKTAPKHPPIAGKTIKRERRKSSNASPTIPGESKKAQRTKSSSSPGVKSKKKPPPPKDDSQDGRNDFYCWVCHKEGEVLCCELCPRVFHAKCLNMAEEPEGDWFCPECEKITEAECKETQSRAMSMLTIEQFCLLLKHVIQRMKVPMSEPFHEPVDTKMFPDYLDYVFHPMDLETIEKNVKKRKYGCPEAFLSDFKWVVHNCILYNSLQSKLTQTAKSMLRVAERELHEIEVCPECYLNSCRKRDNWFCEPCKELHPLVWAKLQGFPHWPAKALRIEKGLVDVRFFGQHDRAWIPLSGCYLISKELPLPVKNKKKNKGPGLRGGLDFAMQEMQGYIENIKKITGDFEYAPPRTLLTHCDLYRKTGTAKVQQSGKMQESSEEKSLGSSRMDAADIKAKVELRDIGAGGKDLIRSRAVGSTTPKKAKMVTTSGEHPTRSFATKKKKASMEFLTKTIESCKASLGIEKIQDVKMNSGSDDTSSSSDEEENEGEDGKDKNTGQAEKSKKAATGETSAQKANAEEDDSDAELVIDLGDIDESGDAASAGGKTGDSGVLKTGDSVVKKRKPDDPSSSKPAVKSILLNAPKPSDKNERKKMLAKALSEKIGGKRKHDVETSPASSSHVAKVRKTHEQVEKRSGSPSDNGQRIPKVKEKEWKKSHYAGKYLEKETSAKAKPGILKSSVDPSGQRKEVYPGERRMPEVLKQRHKDGSQKSILKKPVPDKPGRIAQMPTEADTRKLFNGGRIPRKNPTNISDEEQEKKDQDENQTMDAAPTTDIRTRGVDNMAPNPRFTTRQGASNRQNSTEQQKKAFGENITLASLKKYSDKVMDTVQKVFYEMYTDMMVPLTASAGSDASTAASATAMHEVAQMRLELERLKWMHEQECAELKHNHDLTVAEIRQSLEYEKNQLLIEAKLKADAAKEQAVEETKRKQWCAYCNKEAIFYCCWNTSYCDYPCQQKHWPQHMNSCAQARENSGQQAVPETITAPVSQKGATIPPVQTSSQPTVKAVSQPTKPATATVPSTSPGKTMITISASIGSLQRPGGNAKPVANVTTSSDTSSTAKSLTKIAISTSSNDSKSVKTPTLPVTKHQQKSGSAISAIGARLLAAKQRNDAQSSKSSTESQPSVTVAKPTFQPPITTSLEDHVKATMESPLSPDAKPLSPEKPKLQIEESKTEQKSESKKDEIKPVRIKVEKDPEIQSKVVSVTEASPAISNTISTSSSLTTSSLPKTSSKLVTLPSKAVFSSPSTVASLIAEMGTPMSSTLTSPESSSSSDTPEKEVETAAKMQLSLGGSAFTKVLQDTATKPASQDSDTKCEDDSPATATMEASSTKNPVVSNPKTDTSATVAEEKDQTDVPVVAPVLADSYLNSLHKTLPPKTVNPPMPMVEDDPPDTTKGELPRPVLPESDEDKSVLSESKITDSDAGEPMETDSKG